MTYQSNEFILIDEIEWEEVDKGVKRKIMSYDDKIMMVQIHFTKGAVGAAHKHPHSQSSYVDSGKFEVTVGGEKQILKRGDGFYIPSDVTHGVLCLEEGILIDTFSPIREDFIKK